MKRRIEWIDCVKGYGILLVLLAHTNIFNSLKFEIYTFHMPLFFFLAGYVFSIKNYSGFKPFLIKKFKTLIVPYFCFGGVILIYTLMTAGFTTYNFFDFMKHLLLQQRFLTLWFIACLFFAEVIFYFILKLTKQDNRKISIIIIGLAVMSYLYYRYININLLWNIDTCLTAIPFLGLGFVIKNNKQDFLEKFVKYRYVFFLLMINTIAGYFNYKLYHTGIDMFWNTYNNFVLFYLSATAGILAFILFVRLLPINKAIQYIGENSLIYYALHQSVVFPIIYRLYYNLNFFQNNGRIDAFISAIFMTMLTCVFLTFVQRKIISSRFSFIVGKY